MANLNGQITLLPTLTIGAALTAFVTDSHRFTTAFPKVLTPYAGFTYVGGGTDVKAWVQTSVDEGTTWIDVVNFAFTTSTAKKVAMVNNFAAQANVVVPTDGTLANNTILNGILGNRLRVKITSTGTYTGATTLKIIAGIR
jgi:hypothetical protein